MQELEKSSPSDIPGALYSVLSELELWLCWSAEAALVGVDMGLTFSLKSVIITVRSPTVTSRCWALLLSMFFNLGLEIKKKSSAVKDFKEELTHALVTINTLNQSKDISGIKHKS